MIASSFGGDPAAASRLLKQAAKLESASATQEALARGEVSLAQAELIADRERKARKNSYFWVADRKDVTYKGEFVIPEAQGEMLKNALEALNAPQVKNAQDDPAAATVNIDLKSLIDGLKAGTLSTGCRVSAYEARRMAMGVPPQSCA